MTQLPGTHIETVHPPQTYTDRQLEQASRIAAALNRGRLVLAEPPRR
jgi:hypothetical protein